MLFKKDEGRDSLNRLMAYSKKLVVFMVCLLDQPFQIR